MEELSIVVTGISLVEIRVSVMNFKTCITVNCSFHFEQTIQNENIDLYFGGHLILLKALVWKPNKIR